MDGSSEEKKSKKKKRRSQSPKRRAEKASQDSKKKVKSKVTGLCSGSDEHKAQRWKEYEGDWDYERWEKTYNANMQNAKKGGESVKKRQKTLGWGETEVEVKVEKDVYRRLDIADVDTKRACEVKSGKYVCRDEFTTSEVERDGKLVEQGWKVSWYFEGTPSQPLVGELYEKGIDVEYAEEEKKDNKSTQ